MKEGRLVANALRIRAEILGWVAAVVASAALTWFCFASHIVFDGERTPVCRPPTSNAVCVYSRWAFMAGFIATIDVVGPLVCRADSPRHALDRAEAGDWYCWGAARHALVSEPADVEDLEAAP
jgi:hypothetical protein